MAEHVELPAELVARYLVGQTTVTQMAADLHLGSETVSRLLQARGVPTEKGECQWRRLGHRVEETNHLPSGAAPQAIAGLYDQRLSCRAIAEKLGIDWQATRRFLHHEAVPVRPNWWSARPGTPLRPRPRHDRPHGERQGRPELERAPPVGHGVRGRYRHLGCHLVAAVTTRLPL